MFSPLYLVVMNWVFPLRFRFIGLNTFMDLRALDVCLAMNAHDDNGVSYCSLDMCFGTQLADSRGDIGVIYA